MICINVFQHFNLEGKVVLKGVGNDRVVRLKCNQISSSRGASVIFFHLLVNLLIQLRERWRVLEGRSRMGEWWIVTASFSFS